MSLKLFLVEADNDLLVDEYDVYKSFVVCCATENDARKTNPRDSDECNVNNSHKYDEERKCWIHGGGLIGSSDHDVMGWILGKNIDKLKVTLLGTAIKDAKTGIVHVHLHHGRLW